MAANGEAISSLLLRVYRAMTEEMTPASNVEEELSRVGHFFRGRVGAASFAQSRLNQNRTEESTYCLLIRTEERSQKVCFESKIWSLIQR